MVHKVTVESDDEKLQSQVEEPVEEIVKSVPAQVQNQPQQQQPVQTQTTVQAQSETVGHVKTEEERIFGTDEEAKALFENPEKKKVFV